MTHDDAFDARLTAMFAAAERETQADPALTRQVLERVTRTQRLRIAVIGAVGSVGAALASIPLRGLIQGLPTEEALTRVQFDLGAYAGVAEIAASMGPQTLSLMALAVMAFAVAAIAPGRA